MLCERRHGCVRHGRRHRARGEDHLARWPAVALMRGGHAPGHSRATLPAHDLDLLPSRPLPSPSFLLVMTHGVPRTRRRGAAERKKGLLSVPSRSRGGHAESVSRCRPCPSIRLPPESLRARSLVLVLALFPPFFVTDALLVPPILNRSARTLFSLHISHFTSDHSNSKSRIFKHAYVEKVFDPTHSLQDSDGREAVTAPWSGQGRPRKARARRDVVRLEALKRSRGGR